jgi:hypothetical protein
MYTVEEPFNSIDNSSTENSGNIFGDFVTLTCPLLRPYLVKGAWLRNDPRSMSWLIDEMSTIASFQNEQLQKNGWNVSAHAILKKHPKLFHNALLDPWLLAVTMTVVLGGRGRYPWKEQTPQ